MDCGPTCLKMIAKYYGKTITLSTLRHKSEIGKDSVNMLGLYDAAESLGFKATGMKVTYDQLRTEAKLPCIAYIGKIIF